MDRTKYVQQSTTSFMNENTGEVFSVGDTVYLTPGVSFGNMNGKLWSHDGQRKYVIDHFSISDQSGGYAPKDENNGNTFSYVYAMFKVDKRIHGVERSMHLDNIMIECEDPRFFVWPDDREGQSSLKKEWKEYYTNKYGAMTGLKSYYHRQKYLII